MSLDFNELFNESSNLIFYTIGHGLLVCIYEFWYILYNLSTPLQTVQHQISRQNDIDHPDVPEHKEQSESQKEKLVYLRRLSTLY